MTGKIGLYNSADPQYKVYKTYEQTWGPFENRVTIGVKDSIFFRHLKKLDPESGWNGTQFEVPIRALEWLLLVMARFKIPADKGGYPNDQFTDFLQLGKHVDLSVFRGIHHGVGEMNFAIENRAMTSYASEDIEQSWDLYDRDIAEQDLLIVFQRIIDDHKNANP